MPFGIPSIQSKFLSMLTSMAIPFFLLCDSFMLLSQVHILLWLITRQGKVYIYHIFSRILGFMCVCSFSFHRVRHAISSSSIVVYFSKAMPCCISVSVDFIPHYACELLWESWQKRLQCSFAWFLMTSLCLHVDKLIGEPCNCILTYLL